MLSVLTVTVTAVSNKVNLSHKIGQHCQFVRQNFMYGHALGLEIQEWNKAWFVACLRRLLGTVLVHRLVVKRYMGSGFG